MIIAILIIALLSGCTGSQDITPIVKGLPGARQFLNEHPDARITVTYWSKDDVMRSLQEISQQCEKPVTPAAMYKATISEGGFEIIFWIDASNKILICSVTQGREVTPVTPAIPAITSTEIIAAIQIKNFAFNPDTITVARGTTVTWTQKDSAPHTVTGRGFASPELRRDQTFSYTFNEAGTFNYVCSTHSGMEGKVIVTSMDTPTPDYYMGATR